MPLITRPQARHALKEAGKEYRPLWFGQQMLPKAPSGTSYRSAPKPALTRSVEEEGFVWTFNGEYWKRRPAKEWGVCPDLYS